MDHTFFVRDIKSIERPQWANVVCYNSKREKFCYAHQDEKGALNAGYEIGENDFSLHLNPEFFVVVEKVGDSVDDFISIKKHLPHYPTDVVAYYQQKLNFATFKLSPDELKDLTETIEWLIEHMAT